MNPPGHVQAVAIMTEKTITIDSIEFYSDKVTEVSVSELYTWVIWQFPRKHLGGLRGAIKASIPGSSWMPAIIPFREQKVIVFAHTGQQFSTPELAANWLSVETIDYK